MKHLTRRCLFAVLCLIGALAFTACSPKTEVTADSPAETPMPTATPVSILGGDISEDDRAEVEQAKELGILPEGMSGNYDDPVRMDNMCALAKRAVELYYQMKIEPDFSVLTKSQMAPPVKRIEAAIVLAETVRAATGEYPPYNGNPARPEKLADFISADDSLIYEGLPDTPVCVHQWGGVMDSVSVASAAFATRQVDSITGRPLMELDENYNFKPNATVTQLEAIIAAYRLYRSLDPLPEYVDLSEVPAHTIPKALYSDASLLPDASNQSIPAWRGTQYSPRSYSHAQVFDMHNDNCYRESDFQVMKSAGFNLVAIYISPTHLAWPYQQEDLRLVNEVELEKLDQAIAWAFENGLHVQISFNDLPSLEGRYDFGESHNYRKLFDDADAAQLFCDTWRMIARRYADIPNRYLSFALLCEVEVPSDKEYLRVFGPVIDAIWEESPDRLIIADIHSGNITGESMAKKGVVLSRHLYPMPLLDYNLRGEDGGGLMDLYPDYAQELTWPQIYLPSKLYNTKNTVTFQGEFQEGTLTIGVNQISDGGETLIISIDGTTALSEEVIPTGEINGWGMQKVDREYTVTIPKGAKEIAICNQSNNGIIVFNRIRITQAGQDDIILYPHDVYNEQWEAESIAIQIGPNGNLDGNRFITWDDLKGMGGDISYNNLKAMAEKYQVGFLVGEFGPFGKNGLPRSVLEGYLRMMIQGMQQDGVAWANGGYLGTGALATNRPENDPENTYEPIPDSPYSVNIDLRDFYRSFAS